jgi:Fe-S-cluster containining protein
MKIIETDDLTMVRGRMLAETDTFTFKCHAGLSCFNRCCRNLNLFLYPYDIIRLKKSLKISSDQFIETYTDIVVRTGHHFPDVLLRMADNDEKTCIFLSPNGCSVYSDRPHTCRLYPLEQGIYYDAVKNKTRPVHFFRPPEFCQGRYEDRPCTIKSWETEQEAAFYNTMTVQWADVMRLFQNDPWGGEGPGGRQGKMAFMAAYNMDAFREFILTSTFLQRYSIKPDLRLKIKTDDLALLKLGMAWIKLFLFGVRTEVIGNKK